MPTMTHSSERFFSALFDGAVSTSRHIVVWCKGQASRWCASVHDAAAAAQEGAAVHDVYFGCSLQNKDQALAAARSRAEAEGKKPPGLGGVRGVATSAVGIPGVWADIDVAGDGHKKKDYPPTVEVALEAVRAAVPIAPTLVVFTGGGVHIWWLFEKPWIFADEQERVRAQEIVLGIQETIRVRFSASGWKLDSTHDLARVLRVPGTWNRKKDYGEPRACEFLVEDGPRYDLSNVAEHAAPPVVAGRAPERAKQVSEMAHTLLVRPDLDGLPAPFEFAITDPKFKATWEERRKDLSDGSPSSYDFALMLWCLSRAWKEQDVVDLCEARRRRKGHGSKEARYYALSISRAKERIGMTAAEERLIEHASEVEMDGMTSSRRAEILKDLGSRLGVDVIRVERLLTDDPTWELVLADQQRVHIGPIEAVRDCRRFTNAMAKVLKREFPDATRVRWKAISGLVLAISEDVEFGEESIHGGEAATRWLRGYLSSHPPADEMETAMRDGTPGRDTNGRIFVTLSHFRRWLFMVEREDWNRTQLSRLLRGYGWERRVLSTVGSGTRTTRSFWSPPAESDVHVSRDGAAGDTACSASPI